MERSDRFSASLSEEGRYRLLVEAVTDYAIYMLDPTGIVTSWNPGAQRFKGYTAAEIIGQHFSRFYSDEDRKDGLPARALETADREGRFEAEGWRMRKDGSRFWAYVIIDPIRDDRGEIVGFAKVTRDLTERREAQEKLEKTRETLLQSQKMDAIGQLTGGIAHDFNNLLMAVLASLELMRKRLPDDPRLTTLLDNAVQGAQRGATLTRRLLAFARRQDLRQGPVDIQQMVRGMTELLQLVLGPSMEIETRFPLGLKPIQADVNQMEMALLNLAVNSRDAMPNGGKITIAARQENVSAGNMGGLKPGSYVCLAVGDTGTGMDATTLQRAAEPFFTTKGTGKGTGLGLSMVHGMAQQSGGRFVLQSTPGQGTNAEIWLPVAEASPELGDRVQHATHDATRQQRSLAVVVVDDDYLVLTNTVMMLEDLGHTVFAASSGGEALDILRREGSVDLVLTDQAMPQMTGVELAEAIKREWPDLRIIIATGYAEMPPGAGGILRKLAKPFTEAQLAAELALIPPEAQVVKLGNGASSAGLAKEDKER